MLTGGGDCPCLNAVHDRVFAAMVGLVAGETVRVPLADVVGKLKTVDRRRYHDVAGVVCG